jgi:membrane protease YdiL (CAAX protease family)
MPGSVLSTSQDSAKAEVALDTKRLAVAWLLAGAVPLSLWYALYGAGPLWAAEFGPFAAVIGDICVVLFVLWRWPHVFRLSRFRPRVSDLAVGFLLGYLCSNLTLFIPDGILPAISMFPKDVGLYPDRSLLVHRLVLVCAGFVIPVLEEVIFRGVILGSLCKRMAVPWAVLITAAAATVLHEFWLLAFVGQVFLCGAYLARGRSLPASIAAHVATNTVIWMPPSLMVARYFLK